VRLCGKYRVARMLEHEDFHSRLEKQQPISMHELLYPLLVAYDSVVLEADVELGASEQKFNLLMGREIQLAYGREKAVQYQLDHPEIEVEYRPEIQVALTMPILVGLDGQRKMSKSLGNYVGITETPREMFGKMMSIPDELMWSYWELLTDRTPAEIGQLRESVEKAKSHPMDVKMDLAREVIAGFHGADAAKKAAEEFQRVFRERQAPDEAPVRKLARGGAKKLTALLVELDLAPSKSEAERLIKQGGVEIDGARIDDFRRDIDLTKRGEFLLRAGKKKFLRVVVE
jgi:tyrosyl-tRNA synthetase